MYFPKGVFMKFLRNPEIKKCLFLQLLVCFIFAGIGFYFEYDAARKFDVLNALGSEAFVRVVRNGQVCYYFHQKTLPEGGILKSAVRCDAAQ